jgi:signal transduction histidine kinase
MPQWLQELVEKSASFMPHGHCYLWLPALLWLHVVSDLLIGAAYLGISLILLVLVRRMRLPFSPVFVAFGLFIALCGGTHFMEVWTVWHPDYLAEGVLKAATAAASVATAVGLYFVRPQVEEVVHAARLSEERRLRLETTNAELAALFARVSELDEAKSRFFANVSHELRTPLALILGPAEHLLEDDNLHEAQRQQLRSMVANGRLLLKQVNDLLDLARVEAGRLDVAYAALDAAPWFRRIASGFAMAAEQRQLDFEVQAPAQAVVEIDAEKLERVLINLLGNAFKFTPAGGQVRATLAVDDEQLRLAVEDSGPGVAAAQRELIFERFRQAEDSDSRSRGGSGLGLAIVRDFVALHQGAVAVGDSALGGARFEVTLPRRAPAGTRLVAAGDGVTDSAATGLAGTLHALALEAGGSAAHSHPQLPGRPEVLVVDDNPEMREFIASTLAGQFNVVTASDGVEGLERARALRPDLVLTDLMMPRMSGEQLVSALRTDDALAAMPILLLTAKADDELRVRLLRQGAQDFLTKPFQPQELSARVANLVSAKRAGDSLRAELQSASTDLELLASRLALRNRQLDTALEAADVGRQQAERASQVKSCFLGMVSHELRTPLATVQMNLQMLLRDRRDALPPALRPKIDRLVRAARQMTALVEGLLQYTRAESGRIDAANEPIDLVTLLDQLAQEHRDLAPPEVQVEFDPPAASLPPIESDPGLLRVVLSNVVGNAVKFTREGVVRIRLGGRDGWHVVSVEDTGPGIAEQDLSRIFDPFEQIEPVRRKSVPGVGLGLALVKQILDALGGRIEVQSTLGVGSTFHILLPPRQLPAEDRSA